MSRNPPTPPILSILTKNTIAPLPVLLIDARRSRLLKALTVLELRKTQFIDLN
ncbi:hypothetical protein M595_0518 [Lyngbya aestuarii BL J]|uniref:Uncharacterized protein n=1 Tax=Lyngbya aestuarii BL J TaxID=1348334 RepID=U7QQ90_9CYAN|nr:hypothetical protein M595_0518 [Lyngbya aestuarii BL J]